MPANIPTDQGTRPSNRPQPTREPEPAKEPGDIVSLRQLYRQLFQSAVVRGLELDPSTVRSNESDSATPSGV